MLVANRPEAVIARCRGSSASSYSIDRGPAAGRNDSVLDLQRCGHRVDPSDGSGPRPGRYPSQLCGTGPGLYPDVSAGGMSLAARERRRQASVLGIEGTGWDVGYAVRFLLSDHARFITGQTLIVDGGTTWSADRERPIRNSSRSRSAAPFSRARGRGSGGRAVRSLLPG
jgi:hypothetical protein